MNNDEKKAKNIYNSVARDYHNYRTKKYPQGWFFNEMLEMPATLELLGNIKSKKVLDFGCGTGIYAKLLTKKGAIVKGFDISPEMINIAKEENPSLDLRVGSGYKIPFKERFDIVLASLVIDYFSDWNKVFREVNRVLKDKGIFVFSFGNPVSECGNSIKLKNEKYPFKVLGKRSYFEEKPFFSTWNVKDKKVKVVSNHKTYETIIKTIIKNGFEIVDYKDCYPIKKSKKYFPEYYARFTKIPNFAVFKVRRK